MSQPEYFEFVAEPAPTIKALQQVTKETLSLGQTELARCLREYLHLRLPNLLANYKAQKAIDQTINVDFIYHWYDFGDPIERKLNSFFIRTYLHWFVGIPLSAIKDPSQCEAILNELRAGLLQSPSAVDVLHKVVAQLQGLEDANDNIDVAPYLFKLELTQVDLQSLLKTPAVPKPAVEALSYGFFQSSYYNLMADFMPSPAEMLIQRLRSVSKWKDNQRREFYANFACLVQGSGSGKSRVAKECSKDFYEVYLCLRPESSSGIPPRSVLAPLFLNLAEEVATTKAIHVDLIDCFFAAIFYVIANDVVWDGHRTGDRVLPSTFWDYTMGQHANDFTTMVLQRFRHWRAHPTISREPVRELTRKALRVLDPHPRDSNSRATFLVVLDEARQLLIPCPHVPDTPSLFLQWRSWLSDSSTWSYAFFLLLDTTSKVTNFFPPNPEDDPSTRIARLGKKLLHPIFEFPFLGPWPLPSELQWFLEQRHSSTVVPPSCWSTTTTIGYQPLIDLFRFSRPMYLYTRPSASLTASTSLDELMGAVTALAQEKLFTTDPKCAHIPTVAVCYRYALRPFPLVLQDTLLGSHSATLMGIFSDGLLDVQYLPEPILGEVLSCWRPPPSPSGRPTASGQAIPPEEEAAQMKLNVLLDHLQWQLLNRQLIRSLSKGDRGELATSVYLLHAYEEATRKANMATMTEPISGATAATAAATATATATSSVYQTYSGLLRVEDWISTLAGVPLSRSAELFKGGAAPGSSMASTVRLTRVLASGVSFTGWTVAHEPIIAPMLQYAWCHRVGFFSNDQEPAMDLVLPLVRCPSDTMPHTEATSYAVAGSDAAVGQKERATEAQPIGKKKRALEEDAATEAPPVKRSSSVATSTTPATAGGSSLPPTTNVVPASGEKEKEVAMMAALQSAKKQGFLPDRCRGLSAVTVQVKNYAKNIYLGDAYLYCRMQADRLRETANVQEDVLSVLFMAGEGRVVSRYLRSTASEGVFLFVEENSMPPGDGDGDGGSTFVGLVINGFDERLVGAAAKVKLESLSALLSSTSAARKRYEQEHMDDTLAKQYTLICRQLSARLPGDFHKAAYSKSVVGADREPTVAVLPKSSSGGGKNAKAVAAAKTVSITSAAEPTMNPSDPAVTAAVPPSLTASSAVDQQLTWTHQLISATSQRVERILHVYSLEPFAG